jgi:ribose transport system substrate-binding protein
MPAERIVLVDPELWANTTDEGKAKIAAAQNPNLDPEWPVSVSIPDWTTYSMEEISAC